ncbi:MAG: hypothetical protein ACXV8X_15535, partial [Candidatus Angelobacter sp.]
GAPACGGGGGVGTICTGVAQCGQTVESSGMEAPHLKQNIHTSLGFRPMVDCIRRSAVEKYFIQIEKAIGSRLGEPPLSASPLPGGL